MSWNFYVPETKRIKYKKQQVSWQTSFPTGIFFTK
jgi:hypothetical protein